MNISTNIQFLRKKNKITQEELAEKLAVSRQSISKWETGEAYPETEKLIALCDLFGVTLDDLVRTDITVGKAESDEGDAQAVLSVTDEKFVKHVNGFSRAMSIGVALILIGVAICVILSGYAQTLQNEVANLTNIMSGVIVILFTAVAVFLFIFNGMAHERFKRTYPTVQGSDGRESGKGFQTAMACLVSGVLLDVVFLIVMTSLVNTGMIATQNEDAASCYITGCFLFVLGLIVGGLVYAGMMHDAFDAEKYNNGNAAQNKAKDKKNASSEKIIDSICGAIMLTAAAIYLMLGFIGNFWHPGWVVFPVGGILCAIISTIMRAKY